MRYRGFLPILLLIAGCASPAVQYPDAPLFVDCVTAYGAGLAATFVYKLPG